MTDDALSAAVAALTGELDQVPSAVSAVKIDGVRSYARVRSGEQVELAARRVLVSRFEVLARRGDDVDVRCAVSSGTYVRALARDLGAALGVGGHLTALRRTRVGPFRLAGAPALADLAGDEVVDAAVLPLADAVASAFPRRALSASEAADLSHGRRLSPTGRPGPVGAFAPDGTCVALVEDREDVARASVVFAPA